jgi:hypothetical protein
VTTFAQRSFAGGEVAPSLYARTDTTKYATGCRTCRNMMVMRHGGVQNRPGMQFVAELKDSSKQSRFIPFVFNTDQTYILEFGDLYMRVHRQGAQLRESAKTITGITNANPCVVTTSAAHGYATGDETYLSEILGAIKSRLNGRNFKVIVLSATTFSLKYMDGTAVDSTSFGAYTSGGTSEKVYEITTPYAEADLSELQFVQSADVVTIVHPSYAPRELSRTGHTSWTLGSIELSPTIDRPVNMKIGGEGAISSASTVLRYRVTAVDEETGEESLVGLGMPFTITGITKANPGVLTVTSFYLNAEGHTFRIRDIAGMTELNNRDFVVKNVTALGGGSYSCTLEDENGNAIDTSAYTTYTSGGTLHLTSAFSTVTSPSTGTPNVVSWSRVTNAGSYNVYREKNGSFGYLGTTSLLTYTDDGTLEPDMEDLPPMERTPFDEAGSYPSAVTYYQQRLMFANTDDEPEKIWGSRSGYFKNFTQHSPIQDDDAVTFTMAARQVNEVRHMIDLGRLIVLTTSGEHAVVGDSGGILRPGEVNPKQYSFNGSSTLPPIVVGGNALYVQARGAIVRDLAFDLESDGYRGNDLTIFAAHLVDDYTLTDWTYQQIPHSIVWCVRSDGTLLGLTYIREHQIVGWHRHDTDGLIEAACSVPEGTVDALYLIVKRTINGATKRYVERLASRSIDDIVDAVFMDAALTFDGRNDDTTHTMTLSGGTDWTSTETLTLTSSTSFFQSTDVGNQIHLKVLDADGEVTDVIRFTIAAYTSGTVVTGKAHKTVPASLRTTATANWSRAVDELTGLWHLEGKEVSVMADGHVVANPNNESYDVLTVTNGAITMDRPFAVVHVGLPYLSDLQTLDIDTVQGETLVNKKKLITEVSMHVEKSRGLWVGGAEPSDDDADPVEGLYELKSRNNETMDSTVDLRTEVVSVKIKPEWNSHGRVFIRQLDPLPLAVLSVAPTGVIPVRGV